jgi:nucleoside-diphosphate-sugar epimerase
MIFVTGGTGLLGGYLLRELLKKGEKVKALYRDQYPYLLSAQEIEAIEWIRGDIHDTVLLHQVCSEVEEVYHCAGLVSFNPSRKDELMRINVLGTANVVNACISGEVKKLLHVSSVSALGRKRNNATVDENARWSEENNLSGYGKSKYYAELEVWRGISEGLCAVIVNPTIILGVGNWDDSSAATFKNAYKEFPWYTEGISGFVDAEDVALCMIKLMKSEISDERFIISAGNLEYREVFTKMAANFHKKPPKWKVSRAMASIVWRWERLKSLFTGDDPLLTKETAETAQMKVYFDNSKLLKYLPGFSFKPLEQSIAEACHEYLRRLNR